MIHNAYVSPECLIIFAVGRPVKVVTRGDEPTVFTLENKFGGLPSQHVKTHGRFLYFKSVACIYLQWRYIDNTSEEFSGVCRINLHELSTQLKSGGDLSIKAELLYENVKPLCPEDFEIEQGTDSLMIITKSGDCKILNGAPNNELRLGEQLQSLILWTVKKIHSPVKTFAWPEAGSAATHSTSSPVAPGGGDMGFTVIAGHSSVLKRNYMFLMGRGLQELSRTSIDSEKYSRLGGTQTFR